MSASITLLNMSSTPFLKYGDVVHTSLDGSGELIDKRIDIGCGGPVWAVVRGGSVHRRQMSLKVRSAARLMGSLRRLPEVLESMSQKRR